MKLINGFFNKLAVFVFSFFLTFFSLNSYANSIAKIIGPDVVLTGEQVLLSGANSVGKDLKYHWKITDSPRGSNTQLTNPNDSKISFLATHAGKYQVELKVLENKTWSTPKNITVFSVVGAGESILNTEKFSASFVCKITLGFLGCEDKFLNFSLDEKGIYSIVVENNGARKAHVTLNGVELGDDLIFTGNDETIVRKIHLLKKNQLKVHFKRGGNFSGVGGSFKIKILKNEKMTKLDELSEPVEKEQVEASTAVNLPPVPTAQDIKILQNNQGVTRIFPNDPDITQKHTYKIITNPGNGSAQVTSGGFLYYVPNNNFVGSDQVVVEVKDNGVPSLSTSITVAILVEQNYAPNPIAANIVTIASAPGQTQVLPNDPNTVPQNFKYEITKFPSNGMVTAYGSRYVYKAALGFTGLDSFIVKVTDDGNPSLFGYKTIEVAVNPNTIPIVTASDISTFQTKVATTQVRFTDLDIGQSHSFYIATQPAHGTATINKQGLLYYTPAVGYFGADSLVVAVRDSSIPAGIGTKTISVNVVENGIPVVLASDISILKGKIATTQISYIDTDTNQYHTYSVSTKPLHGNALLTQQGVLTYTPAIDFIGTDSLIVAVSDNAIPSGIGFKKINITVKLNSIPIVVSPDINISQGTDGTSQISYIDPDIEQNHTVLISTNPQHGFVFIDPLLKAIYHPTDRCLALADNFIVSVADNVIPPGVGTKTVQVNVTPNTKPIINVSDFSIEQNETASKQVQVIDPDLNDSITYSIKQLPQYGIVSITPTGLLTYTNLSAINALEDSFQIAVKDNFGDCPNGESVKTVFVHIQPNHAPVLNVADILIEQDTIGHTNAHATDPDHYQTLTYNISSPPTHGTVILDINGDTTYTPESNYSGADLFKVSVRDNGQPILMDEKSVQVNVVSTNNPPVPTAPGLATLSGKSSTTTISPGDPDVSQTHTYQIISAPTLGTATVDQFGVLTFSANPGAFGVEEIQVRVTDNGIFPKSGIAYVAIEVIQNLPPNPAAVNIAEMVAGMSTQFKVTPNDPNEARFPGHYLFNISSGPTVGTAQVNSEGIVTYTAPVGYVGAISFQVDVTDDGVPALTGSAQVVINVVENYAPVVPLQVFSTARNTGVDKQIIFSDQNATLQKFTFSIAQNPIHGVVTINEQGLLHYQPDANYIGADQVYVRVTDNGNPALSGVGIYNINIQDNNNLPPTVSLFEFYSTDTNVLSYMEFDLFGLSDPDGEVVEVHVNFGDGSEVLVLNKNDLDPNNGFQKLDHFAHFYHTAGTYDVTATIIDNLGAQNLYQRSVKIGGNISPVPRINFTSMSGPLPLTFGFDGQASTDSDGQIVMYHIDIRKQDTGTTILNTFNPGLPNGNFQLTEAGVYLVNICVVDNNHAYACQHQLAYAGVDKPDIGGSISYAALKVTPNIGNSPLTISLSGNGSRGENGAAINSYSWLIKGTVSGNYGSQIIKNVSGNNVTTTLSASGFYEVTLRIVDVNGNMSESSTYVLVDPDVQQTPELITINNENGSFGFELETHGASIDPKTVVWDFGNGLKSFGIKAHVAYSAVGIYTVKVHALDTNGHKYVFTKIIDLNQQLTKPIISIAGGLNSNYQKNEFINIDASATTDANGPLEFTWYFGDGSPTIRGYGVDFSRVTHAYDTKGIKKWRLVVTNSLGYSSTFSFDTNIIEGSAPVIMANVTPKMGVSPLVVDANAYAYDPDGSILGYTWAFSYWDSGRLTGSSLQYVYYQPGSYPVNVSALDSSGNIVTQYAGTVNVLGYNKKPSVVSKTLSVPTNELLTYYVEFFDDDPIAQLHTVSISEQPTHGVATIDMFGKLQYRSNLDYIGTDTIKIKVTDSEAFPRVGEGTLTINVTGNQNLNPIITGDLRIGYVESSYPKGVNIEAQDISDPDGEIIKVVWNFGDGSPSLTAEKKYVPSNAQIKGITHQYLSPGTYLITMTVYDNQGGSTTKSATVVLNNNITPKLSFTTETFGTTAPFTLKIDESASSDSDGFVEIYCTEVKKDGVTYYANCDANPILNLPLNDAGLYSVFLSIRDNEYGVSYKGFNLLVDGNNHSQSISPIVINSSQSPRLGQAPLTVNWNVENSTAVNGKTKQKVLWRLSTRQIPGSFASGNTPSFTYTIPGMHFASASIFDSAGIRDTQFYQVFVGSDPGIKAGFTATTNDGINFSYNSMDWSSGHITGWLIDYGDGVLESNGFTNHHYNKSGIYYVQLTVIDIYGNIHSTAQSIIVGTETDTISGSLSGSFRDVDLKNTLRTYELTGMKPNFKIRWNFGDGQTSEGNFSDIGTTTHTYANEGVYDLKVAVTDPSTGHSKEYRKQVLALNSGVDPNLSISQDKYIGQAPLLVNFSGQHNSAYAPTSYTWMIFDDTYQPLDLMNSKNFSYTFNENKRYWLELITTDAAGNSDHAYGSINLTGLPVKNKNLIHPQYLINKREQEKQIHLINVLKNN